MDRIVLLNEILFELDEEINGEYYAIETPDTGVIYNIVNLTNGKSYIGKAVSYHKNGTRHGSKKRFRTHWRSAHSKEDSKVYNDCPIFFEALRDSDIDDWFVFVEMVCSLEELKNMETQLIEYYQSCDPNFGYNYFVGNNKPTNKQHLADYQKRKAASNAYRAIDGKMKRVEHNKKLPVYISYYPVRENGKLIREGYMARIKINGKTYKKVFYSMDESMKSKLKQAKEYIELVKLKVESGDTENIPKGIKRNEQNKNLPKNIRYYTDKKNGKVRGEGYCVEIKINDKRYKRVITSSDKTMESKLRQAIKQLEKFKSIANNKKRKSGSKTNKKTKK